jgi:hypothetical protein
MTTVYTGNLTVNKNLGVTSNVAIGGDVDVGGNVNISGNLVANFITGNVTVSASILISNTDNNLIITANPANTTFGIDFANTYVQSLNGIPGGPLTISNTDGRLQFSNIGNTIDITLSGPTVHLLNGLANNLSLVSTDGSITISPSSTTNEIDITLTSLGTLVNDISGVFGNVGLTTSDGTVLITTISGGNGFSFDTCTNAILPKGIRYGDYLYWNGSAFAVGDSEVKIGGGAGQINQGNRSVAIGENAGQSNQDYFSIAIGPSAGRLNQGLNCVAFGSKAGETGQGMDAIAIGNLAGTTSQGGFAIAIGYQAGNSSQGQNSVAIGLGAGFLNQSDYSVAIGSNAGESNQCKDAVAIGDRAGRTNQSEGTVAVGAFAGNVSQGKESVAVGFGAGQTNQGAHSIAIGKYAGNLDQPANSIILNATGNALNANSSGFFVGPIRTVSANSNILLYNPASAELGYALIQPTDLWSSYPALCNVDLASTVLTSGTGTVNISGFVNFTGEDPPIAIGGATVVCNILSNQSITVSTVGSDYNQVKVELWGAGGGLAAFPYPGDSIPGGGGYVSFFLNIAPSDVFDISIGGAGGDANGGTPGSGGSNGGGSGGSAIGVPSLLNAIAGGGGGGATSIKYNTVITGIAGGGGGNGNGWFFSSYNVYSYAGNAGQVAIKGRADFYTGSTYTSTIDGGLGGGGSQAPNRYTGGVGGLSNGGNGGSGNSPIPTSVSVGGAGANAPAGYYFGAGGGGGGWAGGGGGGYGPWYNAFIAGSSIPSSGGGGGSSYVSTTGTTSVINLSANATVGYPPVPCTIPGQGSRGQTRNPGAARLTFFNTSAPSAITPLVSITGGSIQADEFNSFKVALTSIGGNLSCNVTQFNQIRPPGLQTGLYLTTVTASGNHYSHSRVIYDWGGTAQFANVTQSGGLVESIVGGFNIYNVSNTSSGVIGPIYVSITKLG